ncbi:Transcriptional regulator, TetR family [Methylocella tundrae]|uniref:Transcriptional regulator, TetR family n=2 Tax=Methylocella tundrae TaxID=227605 RepID=A0A8B6MAM4_METTU|nr:Transcriptional regulator, TetR family [Methylocella tundrae]VTZ52030.1 Transcriptional regulator, TetR family [Methylocella tundrae]
MTEFPKDGFSSMLNTASSRQYRASEKRKLTREQNCAAIQAAAWRVFCSIGMDAATVRDIVNLSGVSPGTFYNYFRTKEAIFEVLSQNLFEKIRIETRQAASEATNAEELLFLTYRAYLDLLQSIDGAMAFIGRNQHNVRAQLYRSTTIRGLSANLEEDLRRFIPASILSQHDLMLASSIIIAAGAEAVFHGGRPLAISAPELHEFLTKFMMGGLNAWLVPASQRPG